MPTIDNVPDPRGSLPKSADAHGQAALILVESLLHGLIGRHVLTTGDAIEIIETAKEVQADVAEAADGAGEKMWQSHSMLSAMSESLKADLDSLEGNR